VTATSVFSRACTCALLVISICLMDLRPAALAAERVQKPFLMLISIDGLKPEAILNAQGHGLKVPNLRAFIADGVYASGVQGVLPTLTYPSHTTLMTGVSPAKHGIYSNTTFDPLKRSLMQIKHPDFITVYLTGLDTEQHHSGPFSDQSNAVLERIDTIIGSLRAASEKTAPGRTAICIVSDHGFATVEHDVNLYSAFLEAGLFALGKDEEVTSWKAMPWPAGGGAAIMLSDPADTSVRARVGELLHTLASDPANGIDRIMTHEELVQARGFPDAALFVSFRIGYEFGPNFTAPLIGAPSNRGMHGYPPDRPEMRSSFFLVGPGISAGRSLGEIDMRQIAPTLAQILHVTLAEAELGPLPVR
jgi:predicted AlkP superfamily pyrophosphatase or phosphodiesterase